MVLQYAKQIAPEIVEIRHQLHAKPELSLKEFETTKQIAKYLHDLAIPYSIGEQGIGVIGYIIVNDQFKTLGIRADMDALPIQETTDVPFKSTIDGVMHACGHDVHTATLLGVAKVLKENKEHLKCNVKLIFQPAEEVLAGAKYMIAEGALENPKVDAIVSIHTSPDIDVGQFSIRHGAMLAAADMLEIEIRGSGGHAAHAYKCVDPIVIAAQVISSLQTIISREVPATDSAVITIGSIHGGEAHNIIPDVVKLKGTVRNTNPDIRNSMPERIERVVKNIAASMRGNAEVTYHFGCPPLIGDSDLITQFEQATNALFEAEVVNHLPAPSMGGEDFAFFLEQVPGFMFRVGTGSDNPNTRRPLHNEKVEFEDDSLYYGIAALANFALQFE